MLFDEAGYAIPTTWDELTALQDKIVADGDTPWCIGIESGAATGWAATDWIEEMMLRTTSLENYDKWTTGELKFASPEVKKAAEQVAAIWFNDKLVYGGTKAIVSTSFGDAPAPNLWWQTRRALRSFGSGGGPRPWAVLFPHASPRRSPRCFPRSFSGRASRAFERLGAAPFAALMRSGPYFARMTDSMTTGVVGTFGIPPFVPVGTALIFSTTSIPSTTFPKTQ